MATEFEEEMERWKREANKLTESGIKEDYVSSMDSKYYFSAGKIGATTSPQVANQIGELNSRLNQGLKSVELGAMNQRIMDQVPKEHFTEIRRLNKLTGSEASLHAPIQDLDLAGFTQQGWDPHQQKRSINQLNSVIERAHMMDPDGNTPVTVHAGGFPVQKWEKKGLKEWERETGEVKEIEDKRSEIYMINEHSGQVAPARYRERFRIGKEKPMPFTPEDQIDMANRSQWDDEKYKLLQMKKEMDERDMITNRVLSQENYDNLIAEKNKGILSEDGERELARLNKEMENNISFKKQTYENMRLAMEDMYERFKKYPYEGEDKSEAFEYEHYRKNIYPKFTEELKKGEKELEEKRKEYYKLYKEGADENEVRKKIYEFEESFQRQTENIMRAFQEMPAPQVWKPVDEFSKEKVSESVSEAAFNSFKNYGKKSPLILLENVYPEFALSRAESLKNTVIEARKKFVEKAVKRENEGGFGLTKNEAEKTAEKLIGVTWDVGHIYMLKKSGYSDEDIRKEAKKIAPYVKHLHLTDNFGFEDAHLPPGLGGANIKEQLNEIREAQKKGDFEKIRGIIEAGEFVANFKEVPHLYALADLGSPLYTEDVGPKWKDIWDSYGTYFGGYGEMMPQKYFDLYGAPGFSQLPPALGGVGARAPERGRFAGMEGEEET